MRYWNLSAGLIVSGIQRLCPTGDGRADLILRHDNGTIELRELPFGPGGQGIITGQTPDEWHVL